MKYLLAFCLALTACSAPLDPNPLPAPSVLSTIQPPIAPSLPPAPSSISLKPPPNPLPQLFRPHWDGLLHDPVFTSLRQYPVTWRGTLAITQLAVAGKTLYTIDRRLYQVPLAGGTWTPVDDETGSDKTCLVSDGQHLYLGTQSGAIEGFDPSSGQSWQLGKVPSAITGLQLSSHGLLAATEQDGIYHVPLWGGHLLQVVLPRANESIQALAENQLAGYTLGDRIYRYSPSNHSYQAVPGTEGSTSLTTDQHFAYVGTADGWILRIPPTGPAQPLAHDVDSPISAVGTDGNWLYSATGNTTYMMNLKTFANSVCHMGLPAEISYLTIQDESRVLVGTRRGLYWTARETALTSP